MKVLCFNTYFFLDYESVYLYVPFAENFQKAKIYSEVKRIKLRLYENGIKLVSESWGNMLFFYEDIERVELYRKVSTSSFMLGMIRYIEGYH